MLACAPAPPARAGTRAPRRRRASGSCRAGSRCRRDRRRPRGCRAQARTPAVTAARISVLMISLSRNATCCVQGSPTSTFSPASAGEIEQPDRRHGEDADRIRAGAAHQREIALDRSALGELRAVRPRSERAVGHALDEMLALAGEKEFALDPHRLAGIERRRRRQLVRRRRRSGARRPAGCVCGRRRSRSPRRRSRLPVPAPVEDWRAAVRPVKQSSLPVQKLKRVADRDGAVRRQSAGAIADRVSQASAVRTIVSRSEYCGRQPSRSRASARIGDKLGRVARPARRLAPRHRCGRRRARPRR